MLCQIKNQAQIMKFQFLPHIAIQVKNLGEAKKFYTEVLGMDFISEDKREAKLSASDATFYVEENSNGEVCFAFEVDSLSEARKVLVANNCIITSENDKGFMVTDPHGLSYFVSETSKD